LRAYSFWLIAFRELKANGYQLKAKLRWYHALPAEALREGWTKRPYAFILYRDFYFIPTKVQIKYKITKIQNFLLWTRLFIKN